MKPACRAIVIRLASLFLLVFTCSYAFADRKAHILFVASKPSADYVEVLNSVKQQLQKQGPESYEFNTRFRTSELSLETDLAAADFVVTVGTAAADMDSGDRALILAMFGAGATYGAILPYSRYHESEADEIGLIYAAKAGYDPRAAIPFWERMETLGNGAPPEFLSTHPAGSTRIRKLNELMPRAMDAYRNR